MPITFHKVRRGCVRFLFFAAVFVGVDHSRALAQTSDSYKGSAVQQKATPGELPLSLDDAIQMGLKNNLGAILQNTDVKSEGGAKLQQLQALLPLVTGTAQDSVEQVNLQALGLRIPGFPAVIGPYGFTDFRVKLNQTLLSVSSLQSYLASKHNFESSKLSARDSQDLVVLTVGNAYLLCLADAARISALDAQVQTSKVSLDQAIQNHQGGVSPRLDELRARVDYQTQEQSLIAATAQEKKDRIALARAIGLPLDQQFRLTDQVPYARFDAPTMESAMAEALKNRSDLQAAQQQVKAAEKTLSAAHAERYPQLTAEVDYGEIGVNPANSYATLNATGKLSGPIFEEGKLRGDARIADAQLEQARAQLNNLEGQIRADVKDAILDIQASEELVSVAKSNVDLASEALKEAQDRFQAGVSDNLAVSQAQSSVAQANDRYVSSLYQLNVSKLSLARAVGLARAQYKTYLGGQ
ncbi:MAG TPA: TolC family protein [Acidobacteriaceae bacterium]|nr:TolC family protein [Acidobacteriaceae bacterium]